jgi:hypothetical protein
MYFRINNLYIIDKTINFQKLIKNICLVIIKLEL